MSIDTPLTMSSREIARLAHKRHDSVKRSIQMLIEDGIVHPQFVDEQILDAMGRGRVEGVYHFDERDSYVVAARVCPKFMAAVVDEWILLRSAVHPHIGAGHHEMLADLSGRTETALVRLQEVTTNEVGSVRGYIKTGVVSAIGAMQEYLRQRFEAVHQRDTRMIHDIETFGRAQDKMIGDMSAVLSLAGKASDPELFYPDHWVSLDGVYRMAGVPVPPHRRSLSPRVRRDLLTYCQETSRRTDAMLSPFLGDTTQLYRKTMVPDWLKLRGQALIDAHVETHMGRKVIPFPVKTDGEAR